MKIGESVNEYFSKVMLVANDVQNAEEDMSDMKIVRENLTHFDGEIQALLKSQNI